MAVMLVIVLGRAIGHASIVALGGMRCWVLGVSLWLLGVRLWVLGLRSKVRGLCLTPKTQHQPFLLHYAIVHGYAAEQQQSRAVRSV